MTLTIKNLIKKKTLHERLKIPDELRPYVSDYRINVFDIAYLSDEQVEMFKSDFKIVAKYFVDRRKKRKFSFPKKIPEHVDEVLKILTALTGDIRFTEGWKNEISDTKEEDNVSMGEKWIDEIEERGVERGVERGIKLGMIKAYYDMGLSLDSIAEKANTSLDMVKETLGLEKATQ